MECAKFAILWLLWYLSLFACIRNISCCCQIIHLIQIPKFDICKWFIRKIWQNLWKISHVYRYFGIFQWNICKFQIFYARRKHRLYENILLFHRQIQVIIQHGGKNKKCIFNVVTAVFWMCYSSIVSLKAWCSWKKNSSITFINLHCEIELVEATNKWNVSHSKWMRDLQR
jgi:hypothetical protein